jgi:two-component system response regulator VicR
MKVLIAEDDVFTSKAIEHRLMLDNYEIHTAFNMPFKGGLEVIDFVRNELNKTMPIAVVSRIGVSETVHKAFEMGADEYITKPFNPDDLSRKIKQMLNKA